MSMEDTEHLCEILGEVRYEWKIKDFLLLSHRANVFYKSPKFLFSGTSWKIRIYPNGHPVKVAAGWIGLFIRRRSTDVPVTVEYSISLKTLDGKSDLDVTNTVVFCKERPGWGYAEFLLRSELIERKSELLPSGVLTVICTLKNSERNYYAGVFKLQQHLREIWLNGNVSDIVLKVDDHDFKSHKCILAARSPVFLAMMTHDTKEKNTGVVDILDCDRDTFSEFLNYLYTGREEKVTAQNVVKLYTVADKYQVDELKKVCVDHMLMDMSVDSFCDMITLSLRHADRNFTDACSQFFNKNALAIVETSQWQMFLRENPEAGNELYIKQLRANK